MIFKSLIVKFVYSLMVIVGLVPRTSSTVSQTQPSLSYNCGRSVASILGRKDQIGPLLLVGDFLVTSVMASDRTALLIIANDKDFFASPIDEYSINRLEFHIPDEHGHSTKYFLSYSHGAKSLPEIHQFSVDLPPEGHENEYYRRVALRRVPALNRHLDFSTFRTAENIVKKVTQGITKKENLLRQDFSYCDQLKLESPSLGMAIEQQLKRLYDFPGKNDQLRAPASFQ